MSAARSVSMALVAKNSAMNPPTVSRSMRVWPMIDSTCGASPCATVAGRISNSCLTASFASSRPPKRPAREPRKMQNGKSETMNANATAPAMAKPECS